MMTGAEARRGQTESRKMTPKSCGCPVLATTGLECCQMRKSRVSCLCACHADPASVEYREEAADRFLRGEKFR